MTTYLVKINKWFLLYLDSWWTGARKIFQGFSPNRSFTYEASKNCIPFLDLNVKLIDGKLETDLYMKPIDRHQYLHYLSSHPEHTKRSIVHSQNIRVDRLGSLEKDFNYQKLNTKEWFFKRGYPESVI